MIYGDLKTAREDASVARLDDLGPKTSSCELIEVGDNSTSVVNNTDIDLSNPYWEAYYFFVKLMYTQTLFLLDFEHSYTIEYQNKVYSYQGLVRCYMKDYLIQDNKDFQYFLHVLIESGKRLNDERDSGDAYE